jgi:Fe2+ or Zn2+ uptake regulation protein
VSHLRIKDDPRGYHAFACNGCGEAAGQSDDETKARETAYETARAYDWSVIHPGWRFYCPTCKSASLERSGGEL